jgi:disulfide bond formation protein DsbB
MEAFTSFWNQLMSMATFAGIIVSLALIYVLILPKDPFSKKIGGFFSKNVLWFGFLFSLAAMVGSLVYSNVIGYPPCLFCWYLRIAFYPQVILFAMALFKKDRKIIDYALGLTVFGLIVSITHVISENVGASPLPCEASGPSCLIKYVYEYGFITIPVMGLVSLATLFLILLIAKKTPKETTA